MQPPTRHPPLPPEDDGRTVAPMDLDGMPWRRTVTPPQSPPGEPLTGKALWRYLWGAVGAGLVIVFIFGSAGAVFIWFCTQVWFK